MLQTDCDNYRKQDYRNLTQALTLNPKTLTVNHIKPIA